MKCEVGNKPKCWYIDSVTEETRFSAGWKPSNIGNAFETKEEAEWILEHLKLIHEMKEWIRENDDDFKPDWEDREQDKFILCKWQNRIGYDRYWEINIGINTGLEIYFSSESKAEEAIEHFGEERILKYYFPN